MLTLEGQPGYRLIELPDLEGETLLPFVAENLDSVFQIVTWAREFLCHSNPQLGREGPVCPFIETSMGKGLFRVAVYRGEPAGRDEVLHVVSTYRSWFLDLEPRSGREAQYKTFVILFPDIPIERAPDIIDGTQRALKSEFVESGLMIGQFHAVCDEPGLWSEEFRPLRTPIPLLAIRHMVTTDFPFLKKDARFVAAYLHHFGENVPPRLKKAVEEVARANGTPGGAP